MNPKEREAQQRNKVPLDLLEPAADEVIALALASGAEKYGLRNFTQTPIKARVYIGAIRRHTTAWLAGEDADPNSGLSHLAHIGASVHVVLAAMEAGQFVDDRQASVHS